VFLAKNKLKELHSVALIKVNTEVANFYFQFSFALWHCRCLLLQAKIAHHFAVSANGKKQNKKTHQQKKKYLW